MAAKRNEVRIEIFQQDWIPGFAAFRDDGAVEEGKAHVVLNLGALLQVWDQHDLQPSDLPYVIAESLMHEVIHVLEAWAGVEFSEERVEALLEKYRAEAGRPQEGEELTLTPPEAPGNA